MHTFLRFPRVCFSPHPPWEAIPRVIFSLFFFFYFLAASGRDGWIPSRLFPAWGMYSAEHIKQLDEIKGLLLMTIFIRVNVSVHEKVCYP